LNKKSHLMVREACHGDRLTPGTVLIAPGGQHLEIKDNQNIKLIPNENGNLACPSVNRLLTSMAECFGPGSLGVILTGMGDDGVEVSRMIQQRGGQILVQDESTSLAYSMPRCVVEQELADCEAALTLISAEILRML
jgi:two-component system chemotaxis response regulator CheB